MSPAAADTGPKLSLTHMPELPEVEVTRLYLLDQGLLGRSITGVTSFWPRAVQVPSLDAFVGGVSGSRVAEVARRAKFLVFRLSGVPGEPDRSLIVHLRMTGSLVVNAAGQDLPRYTSTVFHLNDARDLCFADARRLGKLWLVEDESGVLAGLGPEPLDSAFTAEELGRRVSDRAAPVKALLCDQAVLAGIGNIYADEVLFLAGVHPLRRGNDLSKSEMQGLHQAIVRVLSEATQRLARLARGGSPPTEMEEGLSTLLVPRSADDPCRRCGTPVQRVVVRGRSAYFCPSCQRA